MGANGRNRRSGSGVDYRVSCRRNMGSDCGRAETSISRAPDHQHDHAQFHSDSSRVVSGAWPAAGTDPYLPPDGIVSHRCDSSGDPSRNSTSPWVHTGCHARCRSCLVFSLDSGWFPHTGDGSLAARSMERWRHRRRSHFIRRLSDEWRSCRARGCIRSDRRDIRPLREHLTRIRIHSDRGCVDSGSQPHRYCCFGSFLRCPGDECNRAAAGALDPGIHRIDHRVSPDTRRADIRGSAGTQPGGNADNGAMSALESFLEGTVRTATPLAYAAVGETIAERAGMINIGLEGAIIAGAFGGFVAAGSGSVWLGFVGAGLAGMMMAAVFALFTIRIRADQIITGTAISMLGLGLTATLYRQVYGAGGAALSIPTMGIIEIPLLARIPVVG